MPTTLMDSILPTLLAAANEWKVENSPEFLAKKTKRILDERAEDIVMKLLGFNTSWGKWELDHCNGRSGDSAAGDYLRKHQQAAIEEWLAGVCMPKLTPAVKKSLQKQMQYEFEQQLECELRHQMKQLVKTHVQKTLATLVVSDNLENYLKTLQLLSPQENYASQT